MGGIKNSGGKMMMTGLADEGELGVIVGCYVLGERVPIFIFNEGSDFLLRTWIKFSLMSLKPRLSEKA